MNKLLELIKRRQNTFGILIISIAFLSFIFIRQWIRYDKITNEHKFTVAKTVKMTQKYISYKFKVGFIEYESTIGVSDPDSSNKIGTYYLLMYYPKNPKINVIMYKDVMDSSFYGKEVYYPYNVNINFWLF